MGAITSFDQLVRGTSSSARLICAARRRLTRTCVESESVSVSVPSPFADESIEARDVDEIRATRAHEA
jgi:hypothetical protein